MNVIPIREPLVFVYGTLMRRQRNFHLLQDFECVAERAVTVESGFVMLQFNSESSPRDYSPGVIRAVQPNKYTGHVLGEVFKVDPTGLAALDDLEQNGTLYKREEVPLDIGDKAWMYLHIADVNAFEGVPNHVHFSQAKRTYSWVTPEA